MNNFKVAMLLGLLTGILMAAGGLVAGGSGMIIAFIFAMFMNLGAYWFSDTIVLGMYSAQVVTPQQAPDLHRIVAEVALSAGIPKPKVAIVPQENPNAFATGRDPAHAVIAVTQGIMRILNERELKGVIAHEAGHIKNRDTLIQCIAAAIAGAITLLATMAQWALIFGGRGGDDDDRNPIAMLLMILFAPIAAMLVQMAISRTREYQADSSAAHYTHDPHSLAGALGKLGAAAGNIPMRGGNPSTSHLFIVNPFSGGIAGLFSTHPPIEDRIRKLESMREA